MQLKFNSYKSPDTILAFLSDMEKFQSVHPVIAKIIKQSDGRYHFVEVMKLGFIPIRFRYPVSVFVDSENRIITMKAVVLRFSQLEIEFKIAAANGVTSILENVKFKSILPVKGLFYRFFRKQHVILFQNIENS